MTKRVRTLGVMSEMNSHTETERKRAVIKARRYTCVQSELFSEIE